MAEEDPFESPKLLLAGAARHINAFEEKLTELRARGDWSAPEADPNREGGIIVKSKGRVPPEMKLIVFDLTNNLRSALDHAVYACTVLLTGSEANQTKFPFGDTASELEGDAKRRCRDVPESMRNFLLSFQAHKAGNPLLWGLNKLRNSKSHRVLVPFVANATLAGVGEPTEGSSVSHEWDASTGRFYATLERQPGVDLAGVIFNFRLEVLIGTGTFRGEPALGIFNRMLGEVERIVAAIEAETMRLLAERVN